MKKDKTKKYFFIVVSAIFIGLISGFFGGGGGMVCVPLLEEVLKIDNKKAHATTLLVILPISIISAIIYLLKNTIQPINVLYTSIGVFIGGFLGALLLSKLNGKVVRAIFAFLMLVAGIKMIL